jgi:hypothetical protein
MERSVLTIATGKPLYLNMAVGLARSFRLWNATNDIGFTVVTDRPDLIPEDLHFVRIHEIEMGQYGEGFSPKLYLDEFAPAEQTLFIDADCLVYGGLAPVFDRFRGHAVSAVGRDVSTGEWFGDIAARCEAFGIEAIPKFVGALYYLEPGVTARAVFERARQLEARYDEIGLVRLRGRPNEEPLVSLAMALHDQHPVPDDGTIKADAMHFPDGIAVDVFSGRAEFSNTSGLEVTTSPGLVRATPLIAHFNDSFAQELPYVREVKRLDLRLGRGWQGPTADAYAALTETLPRKSRAVAKDLLRPAFRRVFGVRRVQESPRL